MFVYKITNAVNGKCYIGQTIHDVTHRWCEHRNQRGSTLVYNAIQKYGIENLLWEVIETVTSLDELNLREMYWIEHFNSISPNGYNLISGGLSKVPCEETRRKISKSKMGKKAKPEHIELRTKGITAALQADPERLAKLIDVAGSKNPYYGKKHNEEVRAKIKAARANQVFDAETILRRNEAIRQAYARKRLEKAQ